MVVLAFDFFQQFADLLGFGNEDRLVCKLVKRLSGDLPVVNEILGIDDAFDLIDGAVVDRNTAVPGFDEHLLGFLN